MLSGASAFPTVARYLLEAVVGRYQAAGLSVPDRVGLVPAPIVADDCDCGQLAAAFPRISPSVDGRVSGGPGDVGVPEPPTVAIPTPPFLVAELQVAILRCATTQPTPSMETLAAEAGGVQADAYWTLVGVMCELQRLHAADLIEDYRFLEQPFLPAQGGCQGSQVNAQVSVPFLCPCDSVPS